MTLRVRKVCKTELRVGQVDTYWYIERPLQSSAEAAHAERSSEREKKRVRNVSIKEEGGIKDGRKPGLQGGCFD